VLLEKLGHAFALHPLLMEDVLNTEQRPKLEDYEDYLFVVLKRLQYRLKEGRVAQLQVSVVLGPGYVLSFQEADSALFDPVRTRLRKARGRLRRLGPDYLLHALIDCVVDEYFGVLEALGEEIERLEDQILDSPSPPPLAPQPARLSRTRSSRARASRATSSTAGLSTSLTITSGSRKATVTLPSASSFTTTLQGSSRPISSSASRACLARGGLQAPRMR